MKSRLEAWGNTKIIPIVSCLVFNQRGELLLLKRHQDDLGGGKWGTPGGRIEPGESPRRAIERETIEETQLKLHKFDLLGEHEIHMPHGAVHMTSFIAQITHPNPMIKLDSEEHQDYSWFNLGDIFRLPDLLWGTLTFLRDFGFISFSTDDPTLSDGSTIMLLRKN